MTEENIRRRYLLGQLSAEERQEVEDLYLAESDAFEELAGLEDDLIDSHARGELSDPERLQFEQRYFSSAVGRSRVEFARALGEIIRSRQAETNNKKHGFWDLLKRAFQFGAPSLQGALGAACAVLCIAVFFLLFRNRELNLNLLNARNNEMRLRTQRDEALEQVASLSQGTKNESAKAQAQSNAPDLAFVLVGSIVRGQSQSEVLVVPKDRPWIRLEMPIDEDAFARYEAVLYTVEMQEIRRADNLKAQPAPKGAGIVDWRVPSDSLQDGDYILQLNGKKDDREGEPLSVYSFRVTHR